MGSGMWNASWEKEKTMNAGHSFWFYLGDNLSPEWHLKCYRFQNIQLILDVNNSNIDRMVLHLLALNYKSYLVSVQFSHWVVSNSLQPHGLQHTGLPVHHQLPEFTQTHVHLVSDAIQPSHLLSSPSLLAFNLSQHQDLFKWINSLHQMAKVLELQHQYFQWNLRTDFV